MREHKAELNFARPGLRALAVTLMSTLWLAGALACSRSVPATEPTPAWVLEPPTETALMEKLRVWVTTAPESAFGLAAQGDRRFPGSPMSEERAVLAIRALVNLHMYGAAQAKAEEYYSRYPDGAYSALVTSLTGLPPPLRLDGGQREGSPG